MLILKNLFLLIIWICHIMAENELIDMNLSNYEALIQTPQYSFLLFYTSWCHHCKIIMDEVKEAAAYYLKTPSTSILFAKIDGVLEKDLLEKYDIGEYPTLKFLIDKTCYHYTGGRTSREIIEWIDSKIKNTTIELFDQDELNNYINKNEFVISYFGKNTSKFNTFLHVSRIIDQELFVHSFDESFREKYVQNKEWSGIIIFQDHGQNQITYDGDLSSSAQIIEFIDERKFPSIAKFSSKMAEKVFGENKKCLFLFLDETKKSVDAFESLKKAAIHLADKIIMSFVKYDNQLNERLSDYLGVNRSALPLVTKNSFFLCCFEKILKIKLVNPSEKGPHKLKKYTLEKEISYDNIIDFYDDFSIGALNPSWKSEEVSSSEVNDTYKIQVLFENKRIKITKILEIGGEKFQGSGFRGKQGFFNIVLR